MRLSRDKFDRYAQLGLQLFGHLCEGLNIMRASSSSGTIVKQKVVCRVLALRSRIGHRSVPEPKTTLSCSSSCEHL